MKIISVNFDFYVIITLIWIIIDIDEMNPCD